jgi:hypothetical protein
VADAGGDDDAHRDPGDDRHRDAESDGSAPRGQWRRLAGGSSDDDAAGRRAPQPAQTHPLRSAQRARSSCRARRRRGIGRWAKRPAASR